MKENYSQRQSMKHVRLWQCFVTRPVRSQYKSFGRSSESWHTYSTHPSNYHAQTITIAGRTYPTDCWTNAPNSILSAVTRRLHLEKDHPISLTRQLIESRFPAYACYSDLFPVVSVDQNFDSLGFPQKHPGRSRTDTYYVNKNTVLRTHTSAHQAEIFRQNSDDGWLITSDVYRRDAVDKTHYPIFHQMEGARTWDKTGLASEEVARMISNDLTTIPSHGTKVSDPNPTTDKERNPLQAKYHSLQEVEAIASHLKRSLENAVVGVFDAARELAASKEAVDSITKREIKIRWVEAYFPFTSPSWELEIFWQGDWLEILGCGVIKQELLHNAGVPSRVGWAFGVGIERIAMLLFSIPDIRLFWSRDPRFLSQFNNYAYPASLNGSGSGSSKPGLKIAKFVPFSKHPPCYKDVSFWIGKLASNDNGSAERSFHENDFMEVLRDTAGDLAEEAKLVDDFVHPKTARRSVCYRINYRSLERTLTNAETNNIHNMLCKELEGRLNVSIR